MPSVSAALGSISTAVDYTRRNRVVVADLDFPTQIYGWMVKPGVEVVRVPSDDGITIPAERWAEYIDERTAVVATSHVFFSTGYIQDVAKIGAYARDAGALFVVDGYHGAGQLPVDPACPRRGRLRGRPAEVAPRRPRARLPLGARGAHPAAGADHRLLVRRA
jgi:kynureninase